MIIYLKSYPPEDKTDSNQTRNCRHRST